MTLILIDPPASPPVTLEEAKAHCRVDDDYEDAWFETAIAVATEALDGTEGLLGRALVTQTWCLTLERFPSVISVPLPPCQSVSAIAYRDPAGAARTLDPADYQLVGTGGMAAARILPAPGKSFPSVLAGPEAVTVTFVAGRPRPAPPLRMAILMHVAHLWANRESVMVGAGAMATPQGYDDLVLPYRLWSF